MPVLKIEPVYDAARSDEQCEHGRYLDWACAPCVRRLPDGMQVCWCGEPKHHPCHHPSDYFIWHGFGASDSIAEELHDKPRTGDRLMSTAYFVKLDRNSPLIDKEPERIRAIAEILAEREWYGYKAGILGEADGPCVDDLSDLAVCLGRKVSNAECALFTEMWHARINLYKGTD